MSHEVSSYETEHTTDKQRVNVPVWAKKAGVTLVTLATGGAMLGGLSGCGEKAGASEAPTAPAATAPKTPEATKAPEKVVPLSFEAKAYEQRLAPVNLAGKSEEEMTAMWADGLPDAKENPRKFGEYMYAGIDAMWQACADKELVPPLDGDGVARNTEDLEADCRPYYKAMMQGLFGPTGPTTDHIGTLADRMVFRKSDQELDMKENTIPRDKYEYNTFLRSLGVEKDGTVRLSIDAQDFDGPDTAMARKAYTTNVGKFGDTLAKREAITLDHLDVAYNPKTGEYNDMAKCVKDASGTPCK